MVDYDEATNSADNLLHYREELMDVVRQQLQQELFSDQEVRRVGKEFVHDGNKDILPKNNLEE